jgi:hypothetical protein
MRTKWWHGDVKRSRLCEGLISKKIPGTTIVFSFKSSSKNVKPLYRYQIRKARKSKDKLVQWIRQPRQVEPNVERGVREKTDFQPHLLESGENVVTLVLEVNLESNLCYGSATDVGDSFITRLFLDNMIRVQQRNCGDLKAASRSAHSPELSIILTDDWHLRPGRIRIVRARKPSF